MEGLSAPVAECPLTFLKAVSERTRPAHGAGFLIQRHAGVPEAVVTAGVKGDVLIGQAVVAHAGEVHLSCRGRTGRCGTMQFSQSTEEVKNERKQC